MLRDRAKDAPVLSAEEERDLLRRSSAGDAAAAERLLASHLRFVMRIARRYRGAGVPLSDLVQEGVLGLLHAIRKFDVEHNNRFATYAVWWIRRAMQDYVMRSWSMVRIGTTNAQKALFLALRRCLADGSGTVPEDLAAVLAARFSVPLAEVTALAHRIAHPDVSADAVRTEGGALLERLRDPAPSPEEMAEARSERHAQSRMVAAALAALDPRERLIIARRHLSELAPSLESLAREMHLSKERVRVLEKKAMAKMRDILVMLMPPDFSA